MDGPVLVDVQRVTPRRAIAVARVSTSAVIVAAHDGNKSSRHGTDRW